MRITFLLTVCISAFLLFSANLTAGMKVYHRLGDVPAGADIYKVKGQDVYVDANSLPKEYRSRITQNVDAYEKHDRQGQSATGETYHEEKDPIADMFEKKVDLEEIEKQKAESESGVKIYESLAAASEREELVEMPVEEIEKMPEELKEKVFGVEDKETKKRIPVYSHWLGRTIYMEVGSAKRIMGYKEFREYCENKHRHGKVSSRDKSASAKLLDETMRFIPFLIGRWERYDFRGDYTLYENKTFTHNNGAYGGTWEYQDGKLTITWDAKSSRLGGPRVFTKLPNKNEFERITEKGEKYTLRKE